MSDGWKKPSLPAPPASGHAISRPGAAAAIEAFQAKYRGTALAVMVVDCSTSMDEGRKMEQARAGAVEFARIALTKGYDIALVRFDTGSKVIVRRTKSITDIEAAVSELAADGTTNMASGLQKARSLFSNDDRHKSVVVVSDGQPNDPAAAMRNRNLLKESGVDVLTVATDGADVQFLKALATVQAFATVVASSDIRQGMMSAANLLPRSKP
jgi:Mg-chelatase subunit ChlD